MQNGSTIHGTLGLGVWLVALVALAVIAVGFDRALWYDEVFTLGVAGAYPALDWTALRGDVHPPGYPILVSLMGWLTGLQAEGLRVINVLGLAALAAGLWIFRRHAGPARGNLAAILILANGLTLYFLVELRTYPLLIGLSTLGQALLLAHLRAASTGHTLALGLTAVLMSLLHYFGLALGLALIGVVLITDIWNRRLTIKTAALLILCGSIALVGSVWWILSTDTLSSADGRMWLRNEFAPFVEFVVQGLLTALTVLTALALRGFGGPKATALTLLAPVVLVLVITLLLSLKTPLISMRNLSVCIPGLTMALALALSERFVSTLNTQRWLLVPVALSAGWFGWQAIQDHQHVRLATTLAHDPACDGAPLYVIRNDVVYQQAQRLFGGGVTRPFRTFADAPFDATEYPPGCGVYGLAFHEAGTVTALEAALRKAGFPPRIHTATGVATAPEDQITHGVLLHLSAP